MFSLYCFTFSDSFFLLYLFVLLCLAYLSYCLDFFISFFLHSNSIFLDLFFIIFFKTLMTATTHFFLFPFLSIFRSFNIPLIPYSQHVGSLVFPINLFHHHHHHHHYHYYSSLDSLFRHKLTQIQIDSN